MKTILFFSLTLFVLFFASCDGVIDEPVPDRVCCVQPPLVRDSTFWKKRDVEVKAFVSSLEGDHVFQYYEDTLSKPSFSKVTLNLKIQNDSTLLGIGKSFVNQYSVLFSFNKYKNMFQTHSLSQTQLAGEASLMNEETVFFRLINKVSIIYFSANSQLLGLGALETQKVLYFKKKSTSK